MNAIGAIPIEKRFTLESDMIDYLNQPRNDDGRSGADFYLS